MLGRIEASNNVAYALQRAKAKVSETPEAGVSAPLPDPALAKADRRWITERPDWISYSLTTPPVIFGVSMHCIFAIVFDLVRFWVHPHSTVVIWLN